MQKECQDSFQVSAIAFSRSISSSIARTQKYEPTLQSKTINNNTESNRDTMMTWFRALCLSLVMLHRADSFQPALLNVPHDIKTTTRDLHRQHDSTPLLNAHVRRKHEKLHPLCSAAIATAEYAASGWSYTSSTSNTAHIIGLKKQEDSIYHPPSCSDRASKEYTERIQEWAKLYTNVDSLRERFGSNHNKLLGDLDARTARRLYKTLMPTALLPLVKTGVKPQDLAPLAYQARVAAKMYVRERSRLHSRIFANFYDGFRQLKKTGKFNTHGMSYDQVWQKYRQVILDSCSKEGSCQGLTEDDVTAQICMKILERSCVTNEYINNLFSSPDDEELGEELTRVSHILNDDVHRLVDPIVREESEPTSQEIRRYRTLKSVARVKQRITGRRSCRRCLPAEEPRPPRI